MFAGVALERIEVKLPAGFDPQRHAKALPVAVAKTRGEGWELESVSLERGLATLVRQAAVMQVEAAGDGTDDGSPEAFEIKLPHGTRPTDGDKVAARQADAHPGYHLARFEPHIGRAILARMSDAELRCRFAVANALGVKPWDVMVRARPDGGFTLQLPPSYVPSRHDVKLQEVAESVVGRLGWYVQVDARSLVAQVIPSDPPTFPELVPLDLKHLGEDPMRTPFGLKLPRPGQTATEPIGIDWKAQPFAIVAGLPGSGKTVTLCNIIADHLAAGGDLVLVDDRAKSLDFAWAKPFVRDGGWGCDGLREAVTSLALMHAEGQRRAVWMAEHGYVNWLDIPEKERFTPVLAVVDEVSALLIGEKLPAGVDKKNPDVVEIIEENRLRFKLQRRITKIIAEQRFVGMRMVLSTQVTNASTGLPPSLKALIGHRLLQGTNPSRTQRQQAFNVESNVPYVPENLRGGGIISKGVGAAELEAQAPAIYKGYFATTEALAAELRRRGVPETTRPEPTTAQMDEHCPTTDIDNAEEDALFGAERLPSGKPISSLDPRFGPVTPALDENGKRLRGAAAAAHASKHITDTAPLTTRLRSCPSCGQPIQPDKMCGCAA